MSAGDRADDSRHQPRGNEPLLEKPRPSRPGGSARPGDGDPDGGADGLPVAADEAGTARLLGLLRRRQRLILLVALLGTSLAVLLALQRPPLYTARAVVMIEPREKRVLDFREVLPGLPADVVTVSSEIAVITSRANLEAVIAALDLGNDPHFTDPPGRARPAILDRVAGAARAAHGWLAGLWPGDPAATAIQAGGPADGPLLTRLRRHLAVTNDGKTLVINIAYTSHDPALAAAIANAVADSYIAGQIEEKRSQTARAAEWLSGRLVELRADAEQADAAVRSYRARFNLSGEGRSDVTEQTLSAQQMELNRAEADLATKEARLQFLTEVRQRQIPIDSATEVLGSPIIVDLRRQESILAREQAQLETVLGQQHPQLQRIVSERQQIAARIGDEVARLAANVENERRIAARRVEQLQASVGAARSRSGAAEVARVQLDQLIREADASREIYNSVLRRLNETREQQALVQPDARLVSRADTPMLPSSPGLGLIAVLGLLASTLIGFGVALLVEHLDRGLRSDEDIRRAAGLPRLTLVPRTRVAGDRPLYRQLVEQPFSAFSESIRLTLTALRPAGAPAAAETVMLTSSVPEEGKTTLAACLAVAAAAAGYRTLLIDGDLRRPTVQRVLGLPDHPGVVEHLCGGVALADAIVDGPVANLKVLGAGRLTVDPLRLLSGPPLRALLDEARRDYDQVIIDSSPVLGVSDAQNLARAVDRVVLVVQWDRTPRSLVASATQTLKKSGVPVAGVVLTQVDVRRHARYGYGDVGDVLHRYRKYYTR